MIRRSYYEDNERNRLDKTQNMIYQNKRRTEFPYKEL